MVDKEKYIERFKRLYKQKNNKDISDADALDYFEKLVVLVKAVYRPIPREYSLLVNKSKDRHLE